MRALRAVVPRPVLQFLHSKQEALRLAALPATPCDTRNLRRDTPNLDSVSLGDEWRAVQLQMARLGIGPRMGAVNPGDMRAIYYLIRLLQARSVLEVGTHLGGSTSMVALALKRVAGARLTTVDIQDVNGPGGAFVKYGGPSPVELMRNLGCEFVQFVVSKSLSFLRRTGSQFDVIFLDGSHEAGNVYQEVPLALKRLNPNGMILLHDYFPDGMPLWNDGVVIRGPWMAIQRLVREGCPIEVKPLGALPWPTKLGSYKTSLALLYAASP
jgi:predicted O-methyltransferase YrrM